MIFRPWFLWKIQASNHFFFINSKFWRNKSISQSLNLASFTRSRFLSFKNSFSTSIPKKNDLDATVQRKFSKRKKKERFDENIFAFPSSIQNQNNFIKSESLSSSFRTHQVSRKKEKVLTTVETMKMSKCNDKSKEHSLTKRSSESKCGKDNIENDITLQQHIEMNRQVLVDQRYGSIKESEKNFRGISLQVFGYASQIPTSKSICSSYGVLINNSKWLIDCAEGTQVATSSTRFNSSGLNGILITHLHGDHILGLPGFILSYSYHMKNLLSTKSENEKFLHKLNIFGPEGLYNFLSTTLWTANTDNTFAFQGISIIVHELIENEKGSVNNHNSQTDTQFISPNKRYTNQGNNNNSLQLKKLYPSQKDGFWYCYHENEVLIRAGRIVHTVPTFGYVIEETPNPSLDFHKLKQLGIPPSDRYKILKGGKSCYVPTGPLPPHYYLKNNKKYRIDPNDKNLLSPSTTSHQSKEKQIVHIKLIRPEEFQIESKYSPRKIVFLGDTCNPSMLKPIAKYCDLLVHESTVSDDQQKQAISRGHSTPSMAAKFAKDVKAKKLLLTHFSNRYENDYELDNNAVPNPRDQVSRVNETENRQKVSSLIAEASSIYPLQDIIPASSGRIIYPRRTLLQDLKVNDPHQYMYHVSRMSSMTSKSISKK